MPQVKLTARNVPTLPAPAEGRIEYFDIGTPGFALRVSAPAEGREPRRAYIVRYRIRGRRAKGSLTLGTTRDTDLAEARDAAKDALRAAAKGNDPAAPKRKARRAETFKELADRYLEEYAKRRKRSWKTDERSIKRDLLPTLGNMKASSIRRPDVREVLRTIVDRGAPIMANRTLDLLRTIFGWAISEEIGGVEHDPCDGVPQPAEERSRDRVLSADELAALWKALSSPLSGMPPRIALALKLVLVTAQRKGEVASAEWKDMDLERERVWTIPAEKVKNGLAHRVPLSWLALEVLAEIKKAGAGSRWVIKRTADNSGWLFPSPAGDKPITGRAINHAVLRVLDKLSAGEMRPHDLRRSAASHMASMGISRFVIGRILNHVERGVTAVYDRHGYDPEKRQALDAWARRLSEIIAGTAPASNVVPLAREA